MNAKWALRVKTQTTTGFVWTIPVQPNYRIFPPYLANLNRLQMLTSQPAYVCVLITPNFTITSGKPNNGCCTFCNFFSSLLIGYFLFRLADEKKEEGNQLYKLKQYRDALAKYSEAIGKSYYIVFKALFVFP